MMLPDNTLQCHANWLCRIYTKRFLLFYLTFFSVDKIPTEPNKVNHQALSAWPHLRDVDLKTIPGANVPEMFCITNFKKDLSGGPVAIETSWGWSPLGPSLSPSFSTNCKVNFVRKNDGDIKQLVNNLWEADFQPGTAVLDTPSSSKDREVSQKMMASIKITSDGHCELPLLWKDQNPCFTIKLEMAKRRMISLKRRLSKNASLKAKYVDTVESTRDTLSQQGAR